MKKSIYSKVNEIPNGKASEKLINACLVLEGGAFRGLYTQGFQDAMDKLEELKNYLEIV